MNHLPLWYLGQLPIDVCNIASREFDVLPKRDATMGIDGTVTQHDKRNTDVRFAEQSHWFGGILYEHAMRGNKECQWNYDVNSHEAVQYAQYGVEQHYGWHTDTFTLSGADTDRKLTVVCLMNDPSEFDGGEFQVRLYSDYTAPLTKGSVIAFPSILEHRVTPVTQGLRKSATIWIHGPRFK